MECKVSFFNFEKIEDRSEIYSVLYFYSLFLECQDICLLSGEWIKLTEVIFRTVYMNITLAVLFLQLTAKPIEVLSEQTCIEIFMPYHNPPSLVCSSQQ